MVKSSILIGRVKHQSQVWQSFKVQKRQTNDIRLLLPLIEVAKIDKLSSLPSNIPYLSLSKPRLRHGTRHACLSLLNLILIQCLLFFVLSLILLPHHHHHHPLLFFPTVFLPGSWYRFKPTNRDLTFLSPSQTPCVAEPKATCPSSDGPRGLKSLILLSALFSLSRSLHGRHKPFIIHCHWHRQSRLSHAKASSSLWHKFSSSHIQSFLVLTFLFFHLEGIFYCSYP